MPIHDDFYLDVRWCPSCAHYVPYLSSPDAAWCAWCGEEVKLFSDSDKRRFLEELRAARRGQTGGLRRSHEDEVA